jgi:ComF family protein
MITRFFAGLRQGLRAAGAVTADLLWPRGCAACDDAPLDPAAVGGLCAACAATLWPLWPRSAQPSCGRCAAPLNPAAAARGCADCRRLAPALQRVRAAYAYEGALTTALMRLKWQGRDDLAAPLGALLAPLLTDARARFDVVTAVPLHPGRLRARGYNQAALLLAAADRCCRASGAPAPPVAPGLLVRRLASPPAHRESAAARQQRVAAAFVVPPRQAAAVWGRRVLLVDDVVTTGATVGACATALRRAGAVSVEAVALLRAAPPDDG